MKLASFLILAFLLCIFQVDVYAQETKKKAVGSAKPESGKSATADVGTKADSNGTTDFAGLKFGVGISLTTDLGSRDRIDSAEIVNGIVRVTDENNSVARIMLESHYFFLPRRPFLSQNFIAVNKWGIGPFVALQPGSKDIIEAIALGVMVGFKRNSTLENDTSSWNFGLGYIVDPNVRVLGDGLTANSVLPEGEEGVRYKEKAQSGLLFLTSFSF